MEAITSHISTDFDGLASMVAAQKLYPRAKLFFPGSPEQPVRDFMNMYKDFIKVEIPKNLDRMPIRKLVIVDCRNPNRLGAFRHLVNNPQIEVHVYDHHAPSHEDIKGDVNHIEEVGATTTILMKEIIKKKIYLTPLEATLMALGIYEETGSLLFTTTTADEAMVVSHLLKCGVNLEVVSDFVFHYLNQEQHQLLNELILSSHVLRIKGFKVLIAKSKTDKYIDGLALVTHRLNDLERMDAIFTIVDMGGRIYMVARSIRNAIDVSRIARAFGGGGHPTAASAVIKNRSLKKVEKKLKNILKRFIHPLVSARDIMSSPVLTLQLEEGMTIEDAYNHMHRIGHFNLPIVQDGKLVGIVDRRDVGKAKHHGYENAPLDVYMSKPVITAEPEASIYKLQNIMMEKGIGCLPIVKDDEMIGIVTRADVLEAIYHRDLARYQKKFRPIDQIKKLPPFLRKILKKAGRVADRLKMDVYVVGGFVRDLLLEVVNLDVDLVVEGDGMIYGEALARELDGRVRIHEKFGTAVVILPNDMHIDIATSRTEYYTRPAALPEVMESSIKQDLYRRDFTINAMAIRLNRKFFGELLDFFGCRKDLQDGVIRVLHPMSFIDDPTRIIRAVKFEQRYQFRIEQSTENLLKDALSQNIFDKVSAERLRTEFIEILEEARPLPAIKRMDQLHILRLIHPSINLDNRMIEVFEQTASVLLQFDHLVREEGVRRWIIYFNVLVMKLQPEEIEEIADKFQVSTKIIKRASFDRQRVQKIIKTLCARKLSTSEHFRTLEGLATETLLFLIARTKMRIVRTRIVQYLTDLRDTEPITTGNHLIEWGLEPGPVFKKILRILFDAQLDGLFTTAEGGKEFFESRVKALVESEE